MADQNLPQQVILHLQRETPPLIEFTYSLSIDIKADHGIARGEKPRQGQTYIAKSYDCDFMIHVFF